MAVITVEKDLALGVAVLWFDEPGEKFNKLTLTMAPQFIALLEDLEKDPAIKALVVASRKPDSFMAGADVNQFLEIKDAAAGEELSKQGNAMFHRLDQCTKPTVAAIHGVCMGGGTELALACDARIASDSPKTYLACPEVKLGLLPGAGGSQRLPRLVGIQNALEIMLTGKNIYAKKAYKMGLVDSLIHPSGLVEAAKKFALELAQKPLKRKSKLPLFQKILESPVGRFLLYRGAKAQALKQAGTSYPAPFQIIECVKIGMSKGQKAGSQAESKKFGELSVHPVTRQLIHLFFGMTSHKKNPYPDKTKKIQQTAILGAGFMGCGIAQVTAAKGIDVVMKDIKQETLEQANKTIWGELSAQVDKKAITAYERDQVMSHVFSRLDYVGFDKSQIVVEAVFEDLNIKRKVLAEVESIISPECVFASNTSCIPISDIAQNAVHPERVLGMHYFSPVSAMPLLEIIVTPKTADWALATAYELGNKQGKTMIVVNDGPGFYTTRMLVPYMREGIVMLEEGLDIQEIDRAMKKFGFPVGPITLLDEVGIDVGSHIFKIMTPFFQTRGIAAGDAIHKIYDAKYYGRKNKRGFYTYPGEDKKGKGKGKKKQVNTEIYQFFGGPQRKSARIEEIQNRLALVMLNECALCLQDNILKTAEDGDLGAILGIGFPPFLGGPFRYADSLGLGKVVSMLQELEQKYGKQFTPAPILVSMSQKNEHFHKD